MVQVVGFKANTKQAGCKVPVLLEKKVIKKVVFALVFIICSTFVHMLALNLTNKKGL